MTDGNTSSIETLVAGLASEDVNERLTARQRLVELGESAVEALTTALTHHQNHARWEAAKTLKAIASPAAIPQLIDALQDPDRNVRWVAGEALIATGRDAALVPVLTALLADPENTAELYENAHQVLHALASDDLRPLLEPVLKALKQAEPEIATPSAANAAIKALASRE